jgi:hypothetical protein
MASGSRYTDRWVWPWGGSKPTVATFNAWIANHGYVTGTPVAATSYGPSGYVGHIGRFWVSSPTSKLGSYLLITHYWPGIAGGTYGGIRQYYRKSTTLTEEAESALQDREVGGEPRPLPPLSAHETERLERMIGAVKAADRRAFETAFAAWEKVLDDPRSALDSTGAQAMASPEFARVVAAARTAVPLLVQKLLEPTRPQALAIAEAILPPELIASFDPDDPSVLEGEQFRARLTVANILSSD